MGVFLQWRQCTHIVGLASDLGEILGTAIENCLHCYQGVSNSDVIRFMSEIKKEYNTQILYRPW